MYSSHGTVVGGIESFSFGGNLSRKCIDRIFRQEVVHLQGIHMKVCLIGFGRSVVTSQQIQQPFAFFQFQAGIIIGAIQTKSRSKVHTVRHNNRTVGGDTCQSGKEIQILCPDIKVNASVARQTVGEVPNLTTTIQGESTRQVDIEAGNLHLLEVTFRTGTDGKRAERICILECIRQVTCKEHYILLTDAGIETGGESSGSGNFYQFPISLGGEIHFTVWGKQF